MNTCHANIFTYPVRLLVKKEKKKNTSAYPYSAWTNECIMCIDIKQNPKPMVFCRIKKETSSCFCDIHTKSEQTSLVTILRWRVGLMLLESFQTNAWAALAFISQHVSDPSSKRGTVSTGELILCTTPILLTYPPSTYK